MYALQLDRRSDWQVAEDRTKDVWKYITAVDGEQCVMTTLMTPTPGSPATVSASGRPIIIQIDKSWLI